MCLDDASGMPPPPPPPGDGAAPPAGDSGTSPRAPPPPGDGALAAPPGAFDITTLPKRLDARFEALDGDASLRPTRVEPQTPWALTSQASLLSKPTTKQLDVDELAAEKKQAFDLLDALTRSGALPLEATALHVFVAATHAFDHPIAHTVCVDNIDPIVKVERSSLIIASTLYDESPLALVEPPTRPRLEKTHAAILFAAAPH